MSGTDPDPRRKQIDRTQAYRPADAAPAPVPDANLPKIPGITLHVELARGGMGVVYSGRQDFLDRRVAVTLLSVELGGESFVQRFQREAKILAGIKHPNIVACHMAGQTDEGQSYLVMEFIDGPSLKKWIADNGPVPVRAALRTARAVGQALGHAHTLGIIHRDVKPENILLETVTSTALDVTFPFTPKVVDLGLARASEGNASMGLTSPGSVMGTPATMSPEQYDEPDQVDFRTDIYGLGCALYEMLTAKPAFRGKKLSEIVARKRDPLAPDPCTENPDVPSAVGALVQSMLAPERENRPASYKELDEMLAALVDVLSSSSSRVTKPQAFTGEETSTGSFRPTRPGGNIGDNPTIVQGGAQKSAAKPDLEWEGDRTVPAKPKTPANKPEKTGEPKPPEKKSGPGLLVTGEINFLAEGLGKPMGEDGGDSPFRTKPPADGGAPKPQVDVWATKPPVGGSTQVTPAQSAADSAAAASTQAPVPAVAGRKTGIYVAVAAIAALAGIGGWLAFGSGTASKPDPEPPIVTPPGPDTPKPKPKPANVPPTVSIEAGGATTVALEQDIALEAKAADPDGNAANLRYAWTFPADALDARSSTAEKKIRLRLVDGLPSLPLDVVCTVTDSAGDATPATLRLTVADFEADKPWLGFKGKRTWTVDRPSEVVGWNDRDEEFLLCRGQMGTRWLQTSQKNEAYWEWFGLLESDQDEQGNKPTPFATLGLRLELGDVGWAVVASRGDDGGTYSIEVKRAKRAGESWTLEPSGQPGKQWKAAKAGEDDVFGSFSMRRIGKQLVIHYGKTLVTDAGALQEQDATDFTVPLDDEVPEQKVTFFVDKGLARFHVKRR